MFVTTLILLNKSIRRMDTVRIAGIKRYLILYEAKSVEESINGKTSALVSGNSNLSYRHDSSVEYQQITWYRHNSEPFLLI